jgi:FtsP/CotA-like multicopper oxidase with cupredoxin domain
MYHAHAHVGMQLDRGLYGPLVVEPRTEELAYDSEYTLMLDDWRDGHEGHADHGSTPPGRDPDPVDAVSFGGRAYPVLLVDGRPPEDPPVLRARPGTGCACGS